MKIARQHAVSAALLAGLLLRVALILALRTYAGGATGAGAYEHAEIAAHVARGEGFRFAFYNPTPLLTSQQAPAVPLLLAACFGVAGIGASGAYLLMELFQAALACGAIWAAGGIGRRLWGDATGVAAAWVVALYPPLAYAVTRVQAVNWAISFFMLGTLAVMAAWDSRGAASGAPGERRHAIVWGCVAGVVLALGALGEPILLAPTVLAVIVLAVGGAARRRAATALAISLVIVLAPWTIRNALVHHRLVAVKDTFWYVFWQGNNARATGTDKLRVAPATAGALAWRWSPGGMERAMDAARAQAKSIDTVIPPADLRVIENTPTEIAKMGWFRTQSLVELRADPLHYARMCAVRAWEMLWFDPTNPRSFAAAYRIPYLLLAALGIIGMALGWRGLSAEWRIVAAMATGVIAVHVCIIMSARFRLPLEALLAVPAGHALARMAGAVKSASRRGLPA